MKKFALTLVVLFVLSLAAAGASAGQLAKLTITPEMGDKLLFNFADGDIPATVDPKSIKVLFDPPGLSKERVARSTPWKHHDIQGLDAPTLEFTSGEPYRLEMELFFDRYEEGKSVREYTDKIEKLALVNQELHRPPTSLASPVCFVTGGLKTYKCEIEKAETKFTLFLDDGTPVRAIMDIVFKEFSTATTIRKTGIQRDYLPIFIIPAGDNQFKVVDAGFNVQLPADFFGPGSEPFESTIICGGGDDNSVDTTIKRLDDVILPSPPSEDTIPIEIVELNLVSCQPITVNTNDGNREQWNVQVNLPPGLPPLVLFPLGEMTIRRTHENGGTFDSLLPVQPRFIFTPVGDSQEDRRFIDDEITPTAPEFEVIPILGPAGAEEFGRMYEIVPPAFEFNAQDIPWVRCSEIDSDFCPKLLIYGAENGWLNLEPVILDEKDDSAACPESLARADINSDGMIDEIDTKLLEESLKSLNLIDINGDGVIDERDTQGIKDICPDADNDAVIDGIDNCHFTPNPDQSDVDTDGVGDVCDNCPNDPDNDIDQDGICGDVDNCPLENPQGRDADSDGCTDTLDGLFDNLQSTEIQAGVKNSLLAKVNSALSSLTAGTVNAAINQLNAFINQVEAQSGKKISQNDANLLVSFAQNIIQINNENQLQLACIQPPSGIIGWWSGDNAVDLINGNDAVLHDDANFASGIVGNAFSFDGIGDYVSIPYSSDLDPSEITVEFWVSGPPINQQPGNTGSGVTLIENSAANHQGWSIFVTDPAAYTGGIGVIIGNGTQWNPIISTVGLYYPPSGRRHVAMTYDGAYLQLYLDGVPQFGSGKPVSNAQLSTGRDINLGASWNNGNFARFFKGLIDEVEIYDRALTVAEIQSIYNAGSAGKCKPNVCVAAPSDLVGWWTMDDAASSLIANDRTGGNNGIVNGATLGVPGKVSTAADFDGVNDYIDVPNNAALNITDAITIDAWVKLDSLPNVPKWIVSRGIDNTGGPNLVTGYSLFVDSQAHVIAHYRSTAGGGHTITSTSTLSIGAWHHIAATIDTNADVINVYIDGQLDKHVDNFNMLPIVPSSNPLFIGSLGTVAGHYIDGKIDEVEIFNRALSPFEIWAIYNAGTAGKCKSLTPVPWPGEEIG